MSRDLDTARDPTNEVESLRLENERLKEANLKLSRQLIVDDLTGLYNARHLRERLDTWLEGKVLAGEKPAVLFLDVDYFKDVNERHGHEAAGKVLGQIGRLIGTLVRTEDIAFRYAGDEFAEVSARRRVKMGSRRFARDPQPSGFAAVDYLELKQGVGA